MSLIQTPYEYVNEPGIISEAGNYVKELGGNALIIGGKTALSITENNIAKSFEENNIIFTIKEFSGYPTEKVIAKFSELGKEQKIDVVIGIGGGRVLDTTKAVGNRLNIPIVAIPTIAATCASWAAVSIIYDEDGNQVDFFETQKSANLILADTKILAEAPDRYLKAGIIDTLAKWYESEPNLKNHNDSLQLKIQTEVAKLGFDILLEKSNKYFNSKDRKDNLNDFKQIVDSIILIAGLVNSIKSNEFYGGIAHPFYNSTTRIPETRNKLHGEKVAFGILTQLVLEGKTKTELIETFNLFKNFDAPITLKGIGIENEIDEKITLIAEDVSKKSGFYKGINYELTSDVIKKAILEADNIGREIS
ncbi:glycerol dehydrogenase [Clostridium saccharoperbutylacetonicum]|jgi:glycerol dehydrogenase|uniref:Glycerol dehydrogenase GldA n=1 Tax=Clostridium saccharoperbutylacetonicum N1-4(HMT) TaxID=931276 RepID=M1MK47_9CLOT|nr:iron-containing alcohol dehydrogenase family protein [Clostridium saccharoperbutylacetonicum]AGF55191.1 glycerol dehydrogenase GldA [Clostridium saccharoperbutylacetonicum N1-4(HMT)]NRT64098.1 glycerol dehydrogenase [Clostridium saccharoperbutylacetonicum]NSB27465.1 glycerol dehydrogenase [Clostridium saccharoperbutylacetonicum]NSB40954.1 glycerol dehydrogenase [Clostridium saccharoperbutylacetonicum]